MPAPDTPATSSSGGSQQQLEATIADTIVPTFAIISARPESGFSDPEPPELSSVAPGDWIGFEPQQSGLRASTGRGSSDMSRFLFVTENNMRMWSDGISAIVFCVPCSFNARLRCPFDKKAWNP